MNEREQLIADRDEGKILILSGTLPGSAGVGNLLIGDCCAVIPKERRVFYGIVKSHEVEQCITNGLANKVFVRKYESAFRPFSGLIGVAISVLAFQFVTRPWMWRVARSIVRAAKRENDIVSLWVILDTPTTICIARRVANALKLPLTTFVMDACEHASTQLYHDRLTRNRIRKEFDAVMNTAVASGVAGESMKEKYEKSYGLPCQILRQGATIESGSGRVWSPHSPYFRIGFAGTITATDAFQSMIAALDSVQWRIDERPVILRIIGAFYHIKTMSPQHIEHMGWRTREETRQLLSECDVLYLPQPFNETQRLFAELSFPNKLISYLGAQRPVILHAPHYASLTSFYKSFKVGRICSSLSPPDLVDAVTHYAQAPVDAVSLEIAETRRAVEEELNIATLQANCRNLLGISSLHGTIPKTMAHETT